jgi:hypothetical protein
MDCLVSAFPSSQSALIDHCQQWQRHLTTLLNENASKELEELNNFMVSNSKLLVAPPQDLRSLSSSLTLLKDMKLQAPGVEARFQPLDDMYACLAKFDVLVSEQEVLVRNNLRTQWELFQEAIVEAESLLKKSKATMKKTLQEDLTSFVSQVADIRSCTCTLSTPACAHLIRVEFPGETPRDRCVCWVHSAWLMSLLSLLPLQIRCRFCRSTRRRRPQSPWLSSPKCGLALSLLVSARRR